MKEKKEESDEWRIIWKLVEQAINFEKVLKNNIAQSEDEADTQSAITQFLCDLFAFVCL